MLKFRQRSEKELASRLKKKGFDLEIIRQTIAFLKEKNFIDDRSFARAWIESRLGKNIGLIRIKAELKEKGLASEIIEELFSEVKSNYSEIDTVRRIAQERLSKFKAVEPNRAKSKVYAYLRRRGFSLEIITDALS